MKLQRHNALRKEKTGKGTLLGAGTLASPAPLEDDKGRPEAAALCCEGRRQKVEDVEEVGEGGAGKGMGRRRRRRDAGRRQGRGRHRRIARAGCRGHRRVEARSLG